MAFFFNNDDVAFYDCRLAICVSKANMYYMYH